MILRRICVLFAAVMMSSAVLAANVAVLNATSGSSSVVANLNSAGHSAETVTQIQVTGGALAAYDVFIMGRNWCCDNHDVAYRDAVVSFVNGGGGLLTEWDDFAFLFNGYDATFRYSDSLPQGGFINGNVGAGQSLGQAITLQKEMDHPIWGTLPNSLAVGNIDFPYTNYNSDLSNWDVIASFTGDGSVNFPAQAFPILIASQNLPIVGMGFDWGDAANDPDVVGLYVRAVDYLGGYVAATPVPAISPIGLLILAGMLLFLVRRKLAV